MTDTRRLRVLCLHGYGQNAKTFASKIGGFRRTVKDLLDIEYVDAPNIIPPLNQDKNGIEEDDRRAWWYSTSDTTLAGLDLPHCVAAFEKSRNVVEETWISRGPFDGIFGFSQGAMMAAFVLFLGADGKMQSNFKFAVMAGGGESDSLRWDVVCKPGLITIPTLHIIGENDNIIPKEVSCRALQYFQSPRVLFHPGGHYVPASGSSKLECRKFFQEQLQKIHPS